MTYSSISLSSELLSEIFPFHFAINREWEIVQVGKVLQKFFPNLKQGSFEQYFSIQRPVTKLDFDEIQAHSQSLFILEVHYAAMLLKGQIVYLAAQDILLFLGSPWITDLNALSSSGLSLADFAIHDPITDYLVLLQAQKTALADARKLADKLKQKRAEVHKAWQREKELNDLKSRFITTASHEFRTPLGIIASSTGIMQDYAAKIDNTMRQKHLGRIQGAVDRMTDLLEDVLTMNQVEAGTLKVHPQQLELAAFCQEIVENFQRDTSHKILCNIATDLREKPVMLDPNLLSQTLMNLLSNAIKYTPETGEIRLDIQLQDQQILIVVKDSGIGIPAEDLAAIFHPFHRASNVGNIAGTGLGLAIVKHCVELNGGNIEAASELGVGTTFTITFPWEITTNLAAFQESAAC